MSKWGLSANRKGWSAVRDILSGLVRLAVGAGLVALIVTVTHQALSEPGQGAVLGIAVRSGVGTVQVCRAVSAEEVASVPQHMRRSEICETHAAPYRLGVHIDGEQRFDRVYRAAGIHGDRPITIDERILVTPGSVAVQVRFAPAEEGQGDLPEFAFAGVLEMQERRIRYLRLDEASGSFVVHE